MTVLDASVLIAHLNAGDVHHELAVRILLEVAGDRLGVSPLTLAEVLVGPARNGALDQAEVALNQMGIELISFPSDAARRLASLRAETGLRLPDCCVLLALEQTDATLVTFTQTLASKATERGLTVRTANV